MQGTTCDTRFGNHARQIARVNRIGWMIDPPRAPRTRDLPAQDDARVPAGQRLRRRVGALLTTRKLVGSH
jgi:hypothetical protein